MEERYTPPLENMLIKWAKKKDYIVRPRIWREQELGELKIKHDMGIIGAGKEGVKAVNDVFGMNAGDEEAKILERVFAEEGSAYERNIFVPNGQIKYTFWDAHPADKNLWVSNEADLERVLRDNTCYSNVIYCTFGKYMENWRSEKCTENERSKNAVIYGEFQIDKDEGIAADGGGVYLVQQKNNPLYTALQSFLGWGEQRGCSLSSIMSGAKTPILRWEGRGVITERTRKEGEKDDHLWASLHKALAEGNFELKAETDIFKSLGSDIKDFAELLRIFDLITEEYKK